MNEYLHPTLTHERKEKPSDITVAVTLKDKQRITEIFKEMPEAILRLPEKLEFKAGINLVVGENGAGKTTLTRAIYYNISSSNPSDRSLFNAMPAYMLAQIIEVQSKYPNVFFLDGVRNVKDLPMNPWGVIPGEKLSQRQSREVAWDQGIKPEERKANPLLFIVDEFETGISAFRHMNIEQELANFVAPGSTTIAATNSPILVGFTDLPRVDLRYPERGVHRPSDYGEFE